MAETVSGSGAIPGSGQTANSTLHSVAVGAVCGLLALVQSIGFGTLMLSGAPAEFARLGIGTAIFTTCLLAAIMPFAGSSPRVVATTQGVPAGAIAGIIAAMAASVTAASPAAMAATIVAGIAVATLLIGLFSYLLGAFRMSAVIRFIPFPVVGGFLAGTGWLIAIGGMNAIAGGNVITHFAEVIADPATPTRLLAGAALIAAVAIGLRVWRSPLVLPVVVASALLLFNLVVLVAGAPHAALVADKWLMNVGPGELLWPPIVPADLALVDWGAIFAQALSLPTVALLTAIALLMSAAGIELDARKDLDLDRELRAVGLGNMLAALGGGAPGYHSLSLTLLAARLGAPNAIVGVTVAVVCVTALAFSGEVLSFVPTPLLGAVLMWIGGGLIYEWLIRAYAKLSRPEYLVVALIFVTIAFVGFAWGILLGLVAAAALFVIEYGRIDIIRYTLTGRDYQTRAEATDERLTALRLHGDAILIVRLQGFIFFGTADRLRKRIERRIAGTPIRFLVIDFHRVSGLDSSAVLSFIRLTQMAQPAGFTLVLTGMSSALNAAMRRGGLKPEAQPDVQIEPDFDDGLEWCENHLLADVAPALVARTRRPHAEALCDIVGAPAIADALMPYFERVEIAPGEALIEQGKPSNDLFFIESGRASVEVTSEGHDVHLATVGHGAIVGEVAFYTGVPRSASVTAETPLIAWRFSRDSLKRLRSSNPDVAASFHEGIATMLASRLTHTNRLVQLLAD